MTHEKRGVVEQGRTPPEDDTDKKASADQLEEHPTTRAADAAANPTGGNVKPTNPPTQCYGQSRIARCFKAWWKWQLIQQVVSK